MVAFPHAKINLGLHVVRKRPDGYHDIDTVFYPVPWTDALEVLRAPSLRFTASGLPVPGSEEDNLCLKAYHLLARDYPLAPVHIHLHKVIPMGAGLGGGSSDAAYTLRLLNEVFDLKLSQLQLLDYAARLGSDCPFFLHQAPQRGTGRGEILEPFPRVVQGLFLVLVKPPVHIATAEAYRALTPRAGRSSVPALLQEPVTTWRHALANDFEESVFRAHPRVAQCRHRLYEAGALYAALTGSGAAVLGLFPQPVDFKWEADEVGWCGVLE